MRGIAGLLCFSASATPLAPLARQMADRLAHRGPDDTGVWTDAETGIALAHRRLAVLDLSSAGISQ